MNTDSVPALKSGNDKHISTELKNVKSSNNLNDNDADEIPLIRMIKSPGGYMIKSVNSKRKTIISSSSSPSSSSPSSSKTISNSDVVLPGPSTVNVENEPNKLHKHSSNGKRRCIDNDVAKHAIIKRQKVIKDDECVESATCFIETTNPIIISEDSDEEPSNSAQIPSKSPTSITDTSVPQKPITNEKSNFSRLSLTPIIQTRKKSAHASSTPTGQGSITQYLKPSCTVCDVDLKTLTESNFHIHYHKRMKCMICSNRLNNETLGIHFRKCVLVKGKMKKEEILMYMPRFTISLKRIDVSKYERPEMFKTVSKKDSLKQNLKDRKDHKLTSEGSKVSTSKEKAIKIVDNKKDKICDSDEDSGTECEYFFVCLLLFVFFFQFFHS